MAFEPRQFDEHGLPIPQKFVDQRPTDDDAPQRPKVSLRTKRLVVLGLLVAVIVPVVFLPRIISAGRETLARWLSTRAQQKYEGHDFRGALEDLDQAIAWNPDAWEAYRLRGAVRLRMSDQEDNPNGLNGCLADFTKAIDLLEAPPDAAQRRRRTLERAFFRAQTYADRSWINVRLEHGHEAISDANTAIRIAPSPELLPTYLNSRAYVRALSNMELQEGLTDIETALKSEGNQDNAEFLDTRGYLLHLLDRNEEALKDLDRAIKLSEQARNAFIFQQNPFGRRGPLRSRAEQEENDHSQAVMYHHRGLIHDRLGHKEKAEEDRKHGDDLGYAPAKGVL